MTETQGMLSHLKILDLTHYKAGPYCTRLLAGFGAEVIKIERPETGDRLRQESPFVQNQPGLERSIPFHWLNLGKKSITLNLKHSQALEILTPLIQQADVVVENFSPRVLPSLGLDYATLSQINPQLVMASISNFGQTGPYRDYKASDIVLYAMSGAMYLTGDRDRPPLNAGPSITQYTAGTHAYLAILMALHRRTLTEQGDYIDVSIHESALENIEVKIVEALQLGKGGCRNGDQHALVPWECYPTADGYAAIIGSPVRNWLKVAEMFEAPELLEPPLSHMKGRLEQRQRVETLLKDWLQNQKRVDVYHQGQTYGVAFGYLASLTEAFEWQQHQARAFFQPTEPHPEVGVLQACSAPFRSSHSDWQMGRAPLLGEHNAEIYGDRLGYGAAQLQQFQQEGLI